LAETCEIFLLVGRTEHFVKNSAQFVKKIEELEVPLWRKIL